MPTLATSELYNEEFTGQIIWQSTLTDYTAPTRTEIDNGTNLTGEVVSGSGWGVDANIIQQPTWGATFSRQVPGRVTAQNSSITFTADKPGDDIRGVVSRGDTGYIIRCPGGDVTGYLATVYPVTVVSVSQPFAADSASQIVVSFAITQIPAEDIVLPATV